MIHAGQPLRTNESFFRGWENSWLSSEGNVSEAPGRAVDLLLYKDMQRHESDMRLAEKQLPQTKAFHEAQPAEVKARIDERIEGTNPTTRTRPLSARCSGK